MKNLSISFSLLTLTIFALSLFSCKEKCTNCPQDSECIKGTCTCESGKYMFNSNCVQLDNNSYIGINSSCYCYDTLIMNISGEGEFRSLTMPVKFGNQIGSLSQGIFYYELSSGDSLWSPQLDLKCVDSDNTALKPAAYGKKQADGSWKIRLEFQNALTNQVVDNCTMVLKKFE